MKRMKKFLPIMMAAVLLSACAGNAEDKGNVQESSGDEVVKEEVQEPEKKEEKKEETGSLKELVTEKTYFEQCTHAAFLIDLVKYPRDSTIGKYNEVDDYTFLGVVRGFDNSEGAEMMKEASSITDIPEIYAEFIKSNFGYARMYKGGTLAIFPFEGAEYSSIEEVGEINGYEWCRYEGEFLYSWGEEKYRHKVVGYTTYSKNNGCPIFITAMDGSEDQSNGDKLEELAYNCMTTLRELTDEEADQLLKDLGYTF